MQPSPLPRVMESTATATAATTTVAYHSRHCRNNARAAISDFFDEAPIPEDPEPESEPELEPEPESEPDLELEPESEPDLELEPESEPELESGFEPEPEEEVEVNPEQKLCNREKARNKALAKLAGQYNREEDSDPDTESVCDFKKAFENMLDPPGCSSPSPSFEEELTGSILRPYSGYYLRTIVPNDISGSWILEETDCHYPDDAFDNNRDSLDDSCDNNQGEKIPPLLSKKDLEEQAAAAKNANHNSSSTNSSPETSNYSSSFWRHDSDTNTEYSTSASPVFSSPIAIAASNPPHHYPPPPPDPDQCGRAYPYPPPHGSLLPPPIPGTELSMVGSPLSVFDTHSSSQTVATTVRRGKKKYAVKKLLWGKKDQAQAQPEQAQEQVQAEGGVGDGGGNEKKGWKNSLKKSAIAKFLKGGGGSA
ncbi:hypothetical protein B9Z19DRAFT_1055387 [Tuber borchii]|uniref:Uncharacterized protein n=1 Tax=Tuber borchii TaxID=42251 RepID=A0A2T6ZH31_TUBBO|nr:hypothetical protein B9Z19DRAFT_1055387 [Tuber borchii]